MDTALYLQSAPTYHGYHTTFAEEILPNGFTLADSVLTAESIGQPPLTLYGDQYAGPYDPHVVVTSRVTRTREANLS